MAYTAQYEWYLFLLSVKRLLFILLVLCATQINAQVLKGTVKNGATGEYLSTVIIRNQTTGQTAYTGANGFYTLNAKKGDIVTFNLVGYKEERYAVPSSLGAAEMYVSLFQMSYELDEFIFRPKFTPYQIDSMERKSTYARALARQKGGSVMSPVTFVAEKISKRSKRFYKFQKNFYQWEEEKFVATRYTEALVTSQTGLRDDTVAYFMNANPMPYDFARVASDLEIKVWIREQYKEWLKNPIIPVIKPSPADSAKH
jgi:hypothetical protein